jgi:nicotinamidase-related amidase
MPHALEVQTVNRIVRAMREAGDPVVSVWDGEEDNAATTATQVREIVFSVDEAWLYTRSEGWIFLVCGNEGDMLTDYTLRLETALKPVNDWLYTLT